MFKNRLVNFGGFDCIVRNSVSFLAEFITERDEKEEFSINNPLLSFQGLSKDDDSAVLAGRNL